MKLPILRYTRTYRFDPRDGYFDFCRENEYEPTLENWKEWVFEDVLDMSKDNDTDIDDLVESEEVEDTE
jgi:hypothetical protein